jgi:hypothetical protein
MTVLGVGSVRSCGASTLALGLAATWPLDRRMLLLEADPAGGTLAAAAGFPTEPSLVSLAAAVRRTDAVELALAHTHALPGGGAVLTAPPTAVQSERALAMLTHLLGHLDHLDTDVVLDCGRLASLPERNDERTSNGVQPRSNTERWLATDVALIATRPQLPDLHALGGFLDHPRLATARNDGRLRLVLIGSGPYGDEEIAEVFGAPVVAHLPFDADAAVALATTPADARELRRSALVRELRSLAATISLAIPPSREVSVDVSIDGETTRRGPRRFRPAVPMGVQPDTRSMNGAHANGTSEDNQ